MTNSIVLECEVAAWPADTSGPCWLKVKPDEFFWIWVMGVDRKPHHPSTAMATAMRQRLRPGMRILVEGRITRIGRRTAIIAERITMMSKNRSASNATRGVSR